MNDDPPAGKEHTTQADLQTHGHNPQHDASSGRSEQRTLFNRLLEYFLPGANSKAELIEFLAEAEEKEVIAAESRVMLEGVLRLAEMHVADALVAAPRMDAINVQEDPKRILHFVIETAHSRFPVYEGEPQNIIGILHAKDLLKLQQAASTVDLRALLRPAVFIPESKPLNDVLREFRTSRNHLAIVIDEFGQVAGLITIEDVVEQIVGDIQDEFDLPEDNSDIFGLADQTYRISGDADLDRVNKTFGTHLASSDGETFDTIGGLIAHEMGHVPKRGESFHLGNMHFLVLHTKGALVRWFKVWQEEAPGN